MELETEREEEALPSWVAVMFSTLFFLVYWIYFLFQIPYSEIFDDNTFWIKALFVSAFGVGASVIVLFPFVSIPVVRQLGRKAAWIIAIQAVTSLTISLKILLELWHKLDS